MDGGYRSFREELLHSSSIFSLLTDDLQEYIDNFVIKYKVIFWPSWFQLLVQKSQYYNFIVGVVKISVRPNAVLHHPPTLNHVSRTYSPVANLT